MSVNLLTRLLTSALVLGLSSMTAAQTTRGIPEDSLLPSWSDNAMSEGWRAVCGDVRNVGHMPARRVALQVQALDTAGQVLSSKERYVAADVPAGSRVVFCVPMPAGATSYNVSVRSADWGLVEAP